MTGYNFVLRLRRFEEEINKLGLRMAHPKHGGYREYDAIALLPQEQELPVYSRDAELYIGTIEQAEEWLRGVQWARQYDRLLMGQNIDKKRQRKEQDYRNAELAKRLAQKESQ